MTRRRTGFTLIELLVVIAIIAILAAMLFPVFARARESARKIQCLSNVKNIAMAMQLYLGDYDAFPPGEHDQAEVAYFASGGGAGCWGWWRIPARANPYLRWPVILDEYVKNRDVYSCPAARIEGGAAFIVGLPDFLQYYKNTQGQWGSETVGPCAGAWPQGWGGAVTDSCAQQAYGQPAALQTGVVGTQAVGAFAQSIGFSELGLVDTKLSVVPDSSSLVVVAEQGTNLDRVGIWFSNYPDVCQLSCVGPGKCGGGAGGPVQDLAPPVSGIAITDVSYRKQNYARHLGGTNIGFADGHARWIDSEAFAHEVLEAHYKHQLTSISDYGFTICGPNSYTDCCGLPKPYLW